MKLVRLNKVIEETDLERIREYKLLGFVEEGEPQKTSGSGREPMPEKPKELSELSQEPKTRKSRSQKEKIDIGTEL